MISRGITASKMTENGQKSPVFGQKMAKKSKKSNSKPKRRKMAQITVKLLLLPESLAILSMPEPPEDLVGSCITFYEKSPGIGIIS